MMRTVKNLKRLTWMILLGSLSTCVTALLNLVYQGAGWSMTLLIICGAITLWALVSSHRMFHG